MLHFCVKIWSFCRGSEITNLTRKIHFWTLIKMFNVHSDISNFKNFTHLQIKYRHVYLIFVICTKIALLSEKKFLPVWSECIWITSSVNTLFWSPVLKIRMGTFFSFNTQDWDIWVVGMWPSLNTEARMDYY